MGRAVAALIVAVAMIAVGQGGPADARKKRPIPITACDTIADKPGRTYRLTGNLSCVGQSAVVVTANKVTIDLGGHVVTGDGAGESGILNLAADRVTIRNGGVRRFGIGVDIGVDTVRNSISGVVVTSSQTIGIRILGGAGTERHTIANNVVNHNGSFGITASCDGCRIAGNALHNNAGSFALDIFGTKTLVQSNVVVANRFIGAELQGSKLRVRSNVVVSNGSAANPAFLKGVTSNCVSCSFSSNIVSANPGEGILGSGRGNAFSWNIVSGNGADGIKWQSDAPASGPRTSVVRNTVTSNGLDGVELGPHDAPATIDRNRFVGNGGNGLLLADTAGASSITRNVVSANDAHGMDLADGSYTVDGNAVHGNGYDGPADAVGLGILADLAAAVRGRNRVDGNDEPAECLSPSASLCVSPVSKTKKRPIPITTCGQTLTAPGRTYVLTGDLVCVNQHGLTIGADRITVDLRGFTIFGDGAGEVGIRSGGAPGVGNDRTVVRNGAVRAFRKGVELGFIDTRTTVTGITAVDSDEIGIDVPDLVNKRHRLIGNTSVLSASFGIRGGLNSGSLISGNIAHRATSGGFDAGGNSGGVFAGNIATANGARGMRIGGPGHRISSNISTSNGQVIAGPRDGISTVNCRSCVLTGNISLANPFEGFEGESISGASDGARLQGNVSAGNGGHGILWTNAGPSVGLRHLSAVGNTIVGNGLDGLEFASLLAPALADRNRIIGNGENGILFAEADGTTIRRNTVAANDFHGIVPGNDSYTIDRNAAHGNGYDGLSDGFGEGIFAVNAVGLSGSNRADGNDSVDECRTVVGVGPPNFCT